MSTKTWRRIATWTARLVLFAALGLVAFAVAVLTVIPRATHGAALTVLTGSMRPTIPVGSLVIDRPVDPGTLRVGDVATYQKEPGRAEFITHRIVGIDTKTTPTTFTFKGDANRGPDITKVPATAIRGKVWFHVPYLGAIRDALHTGGGLAAAAMVLLGAYALYQLYGAIRDNRTKITGPSVDPAAEPDASAVILASFSTGTLDGLSPQIFAGLLRATLAEVNQATGAFSVLLSCPPSRADDTVRLLQRFEPISLEVSGVCDA